MPRSWAQAVQQQGERAILGSREEYELFLQRYDKYPRFVRKWPPPSVGKPQPQLLDKVVGDVIKRALKPDSWQGIVVRVEEGDGKSWSAAAVDRLVGKHVTGFRRHQITPERPLDGLPQIVELIPKRKLITLAQSSGAAPPLPALRRRSILIAGAALLLFAAAVAVLQSIVKMGGGASAAIVPVSGASVAGLLFASQEITARLKRSEREADERKLIDALDRAPEDSPQAWAALKEALSAELDKAEADRVVIVDDFDLLDELTRETLRHYFLHRLQPSDVRELWVVFEDAELATLSTDLDLAPTRKRRSWRTRLELLQQTLLDEDARNRLANEAGLPERADFRLVKSITHRESDAAEAYGSLLDGEYAAQRHDGSPYGPLELAFLLAVHHRTGAWAFREQELVSDLSSKARSAQREVLELLLPGATFTRGEVGDAIELLQADLGRALDSERLAVGEIELVREAADLLVARRDDYDLPGEGLAHLFWAFYLHSKLVGAGRVDPYRLRKLARHLVSATAPGALGPHVNQAIQDRFGEAAIWTARELMAASLPEEIHKLLVRAERETTRAADRALLRSVCWQAYAVLGDEDLLALILQLHQGTPRTRSGAAELDSLFVDSLRFRNGPARPVGELAGLLPTLDREIITYAQARGLWLALTLHRITEGEWATFSGVARGGCSRARGLVQQALSRLGEDPIRPRVSIDALTASLGAWCYGLAFPAEEETIGEAADLLEDVRLHAAQLHDVLDERRKDGANEDYVLRSFAHELEAVAGAAALLIAKSIGSAAGTPEDHKRLGDHTRGAIALGTSGADPAPGVAHVMNLQALTWMTLGYSSRRPLGFDQLATFMTLRQVHLSVLIQSRSETAVNGAISALAGQLDEPGVVGLMAHAIAINGSPSKEITALLWARAIELALESGFGSALETELCFVALAASHGFEAVDKAKVVERLIRDSRPTSGETFLATRLAQLDDETRRDAALWLLNSAITGGVSPAVANTLKAETEKMRDGTQDQDARDDVQESIELFEIQRDEEADRPVSAAAILKQWEHRGESRNYAWMLDLLVRGPGIGADTTEAAIAFLTRQSGVPPTTAPILLAHDLARLGGGSVHISDEQRSTALTYLDRVQPSMDYTLSIDTNISILRLLLRNSVGDGDGHMASLEHWIVAQQERDGLRKLPRLVEAGKFFLVLWHYYETLHFYGLSTEPDADVAELSSSERQREALGEWRARGEPIPDATVPHLQETRLSADYLRYGLALFGGGGDDPGLADARSKFNETALTSLPALFDQLTSLDSLPRRVRSLLEEHRARLLRTALPDY